MLMNVAQMSAAIDTISSRFVAEGCWSRFSRRRAQNPGFSCWLGWSGTIAGVGEVVGFLDDMLSAWFLVRDSSWCLRVVMGPLGLKYLESQT